MTGVVSSLILPKSSFVNVKMGRTRRGHPESLRAVAVDRKCYQFTIMKRPYEPLDSPCATGSEPEFAAVGRRGRTRPRRHPDRSVPNRRGVLAGVRPRTAS